jgi:hypothetical protein
VGESREIENALIRHRGAFVPSKFSVSVMARFRQQLLPA